MQSTNLIANHQNFHSLSDPKCTVAVKCFSYEFDLKEVQHKNGCLVPLKWATLSIKGFALLMRDGSCDVSAIEVFHEGHNVSDLIRGLMRWDWIEKSVTAWVKDEVFPEYLIHTHLKTA